jgi:hypothetical protein
MLDGSLGTAKMAFSSQSRGAIAMGLYIYNIYVYIYIYLANPGGSFLFVAFLLNRVRPNLGICSSTASAILCHCPAWHLELQCGICLGASRFQQGTGYTLDGYLWIYWYMYIYTVYIYTVYIY